MKSNKRPISTRVEDSIHQRIELVALVDRRSVADIVAECVRRALPALESELERPRLTPDMKRRIAAGENVASVIMEHLSPYAITSNSAPAHDAPRKPAK